MSILKGHGIGRRLLGRERVRKLNREFELTAWRGRAFGLPIPALVKWAVIKRFAAPDCTFVESGTLAGDTTAFSLKFAKAAVSLEPEPTLFAKAAQRFAKDDRVRILNGTSEDLFPSLLPTLSGNVTFWLDGHYSGGTTFGGGSHCPVREELDAIASCRTTLGEIVVLIDDITDFPVREAAERSAYPSMEYLTSWAKTNGMLWRIEQNIFVLAAP